MKIVTAKILDVTDLELDQPIFTHQGKTLQIFLQDVVLGKENVWIEATNNFFEEADNAQDAIYDKLNYQSL